MSKGSHQFLTKALRFSDDQYKLLLNLWKNAGYFHTEHLEGIVFKEFIQIEEPDALKKALDIGNKFHSNQITVDDFINEFLAEDRFSVQLLAMSEYFCQSWFAGAEEKEIYLTKSTEFSENNEDLLLKLANSLELFKERKLEGKVDVGLFIGATSRTIASYLEKMKPIIGSCDHTCILLSSRPLINRKVGADIKTLTRDNPQKSDPTGFSYDGDASYVDFLMKRFDIEDEDNVREGHAMLHQLMQMFPVLKDQQNVGVQLLVQSIYGQEVDSCEIDDFMLITGTKDSPVFYKEVLELAKGFDYIQNDGSIVVNGIAPHLPRFERQAEVACLNVGLEAMTVYSHGGSAEPNPKFLPRTFAVYVHTCYELGRQLLSQQGKQALPEGPLQWSNRKGKQAGLNLHQVGVFRLPLGDEQKSKKMGAKPVAGGPGPRG